MSPRVLSRAGKCRAIAAWRGGTRRRRWEQRTSWRCLEKVRSAFPLPRGHPAPL